MPIFMKIDKIPGSSTTEGFADQIELSSFQWGAGIACTAATGGDRTQSAASVSEITGTKVTDKSTEKLFKSLLLGESVGKATISFVASSKGESTAYATLTLEEVIISGFSMSTGGDFPTESLSLNFIEFDWSFTPRDETQGGDATHLIYSLVTNKVK